MTKDNFYESLLKQNIPLTPYYRIRDDGFCACKDAELCKYPGKHSVLGDRHATRKISLFKEWKSVYDVGIVIEYNSKIIALEVGIHDGKYSYEHYAGRLGLESYLSWEIDNSIYHIFKFDDAFEFRHKCGEELGVGVKLYSGYSSIKGPYCLTENRNIVEPIFHEKLNLDWKIDELTSLPTGILKLISDWGKVCI
jgi:hypothetical protein